MSCPKKGYGTKPQSDAYLSAHLTTQLTINRVPVYPSFTPILNTLSITSSSITEYANVYVSGYNFLPNGVTKVKFGSTTPLLNVIYYSSYSISFVIPLHSVTGNYAVQIVNIYDNNFSPQVNQRCAGNYNVSDNAIIYTIV